MPGAKLPPDAGRSRADARRAEESLARFKTWKRYRVYRATEWCTARDCGARATSVVAIETLAGKLVVSSTCNKCLEKFEATFEATREVRGG